MSQADFHQDLMDAHARALQRDPQLDEEGLADSEEVAEVLARWSRPTITTEQQQARAEEWTRQILASQE